MFVKNDHSVLWSGMPKVSDEYRSAKRTEITEAALRAFRRSGFQGTSMADIIAESGLSAGAIYGYFKGKADIVQEVAHTVVSSRVRDIEQMAGQEPMPHPSEVLRVLMHGMEATMGGSGILVQLWGEAVTEPELRTHTTIVLTRLRAAFANYLSLWNQRMHGLSAAEADALGAVQARLYVAASQSYMVQDALIDDFDREEYLTAIAGQLPS